MTIPGGIFTIILFGVWPAFARDVNCEHLLRANGPASSESVSNDLEQRFGVQTDRESKSSDFTAAFEFDDFGRPVIRLGRKFEKISAARQFATILHEALHWSTYKKKQNAFTDIMAARDISAFETPIDEYEDFYSFDELEARLREAAALMLDASNNLYAHRAADQILWEIHNHIRQQKYLINSALKMLEAGELELHDNGYGELEAVPKASAPRKWFSKLHIPKNIYAYEEDALKVYAQKILRVRLNSIEIHRATAHRLRKRLGPAK